MIKNEFNNYKHLREGKTQRTFFDDLRDGFYRCCSSGFIPFIFEQFINPNTWKKSIFHKFANSINIVNLLFTGYTWGYGNLKALLVWGFRTHEQLEAQKAERRKDTRTAEVHYKRAKEFDTKYQSIKRMAIIGSIANPTMQGLNQCADALAFIFGKIPAKDFFKNPFHGISRLISLVVGIPESFAKFVDSLVRVTVKERKHLTHALPGPFLRLAEKIGNWLEPRITNNGFIKTIKNFAEMIFHTLSPLSMFALFAPLLGESHLDKEAQRHGGLQGLLDKVIGRTGKTLTLFITGIYVTFGRLPQSYFQLRYFIRKYIGKVRGESTETTRAALLKLKNELLNSPIIGGVSKIARGLIRKLVGDFYSKTKEIENGFPSYEQIEAKYGFEQGAAEYESLLKEGADLTEGKIQEIVNTCLGFVRKNAVQGNYILDSKEEEKISRLIKNKVLKAISTDPDSINPKPRKVKLLFPGADFIARFILRGFDLKSRLKNINWKSDHHVKETAYVIDELWNFDAELPPVICECVHGLRNTVNRVFNIFRFLGLVT